MAGLSADSAERLLKTGEYSDFKVTCQGREWRVHKAIICPESSFFQAMCNGQFKEGQGGVADLPEDDPNIVQRVLDYLYLGKYEATVKGEECACCLKVTDIQNTPTTLTQSHAESSPILQTSTVTLATSRLEAGSREESAESIAAFRAPVFHELWVHAKTYQCADRLDINKLKVESTSLFENTLDHTLVSQRPFVDTVKDVLECTTTYDTMLRSDMLQFCVNHYATIAESEMLNQLISQHEPVLWKVMISIAGQLDFFKAACKASREEFAKTQADLQLASSVAQGLEEDIGRRVAQAKAEATLSFNKEQRKHKKELDTANTSFHLAVDRLNWAKTRLQAIDSMIEMVNKRKHCLNCGKVTQVDIERSEEIQRISASVKCRECMDVYHFRLKDS